MLAMVPSVVNSPYVVDRPVVIGSAWATNWSNQYRRPSVASHDVRDMVTPFPGEEVDSDRCTTAP
eukprot:COSAG04_NODE_30545_length_262_cov_0.625767_1_plen_64_part_01